MQVEAIEREILPGGKVILRNPSCSFAYERQRPGKLIVTVNGTDRGQFGSSTIDEILLAMQREGPIELYVDTRQARSISVDVSDDWTRFFMLNRAMLRRVHVLVVSEFIQLTISIAKHLSGTGDLIRIHSSEQGFKAAMDR